jgi:type III secretion protein C
VHNDNITRRRIATYLGAAGLGIGAGAAHAGALEWETPGRMTPIVARDMPLTQFFEALVATQSIAVKVSPAAASKTVNGRFTGNPAAAFDSVVRSLSLLPYFDGSTLHIYLSQQVQRRTLNVPAGETERVVSTLDQLRLHDGRFNTFTAVPESGLLRIAGAKPFVDQIQEVVKSATRSAVGGPERIAVYKLRYAWAWDVTLTSAGKQIVVPGVASLLRSLLTRTGVVSVVEAPKARSAGVGKLKGKGFIAGNTGETVDTRTSANAAPVPGQPPGTGEATNEGSRTSGSPGATVTAEVRTNSVIVRDTPDRLPQYAELIRALDVEPLMVEVEATIVDVNSDRVDDLGVNWRILGDTSETRLGTGTSLDQQLRSATINGVTPSSLGFAWSTVRDSGKLIARITALAADGSARVVSRAQVATMANLEASIQSSETSYIRVAGVQDVDLFPVTASTSVRITPQVVIRQGRNILSMVVGIRDGAFTDAVVDKIPSVKEVSLSTHGLVADNQTFVIGGFKQERSSRSADRIPILGEIPYLGAAFRSTKEQSTRVERMFFLSPRVLTLSALIARQDGEIPPMPQPRPSWFGSSSEPKAASPGAGAGAAPSTGDPASCFRPHADPSQCMTR